VLAWQTAHSIARGSPAPVHDRGGFRVDTNSEKEATRWVFPHLCDGLREIARSVSAPRHFLKLCGTGGELKSAVPATWEIQPAGYFMRAGATRLVASALPEGYALERCQTGPVTQVRIIASDGSVAACGSSAETVDAFVYDRIETSPDHRRKGLGATVMTALAAARKYDAVPQLLVATEEGHALYTRLGWEVLWPFATATVPAG